jgi:uncharacterized protein YqgC (DUF456 family)
MRLLLKSGPTINFFFYLFPVGIYIFFFIAVPFCHYSTNRDLQPALKINVDSLSVIVGLLVVSLITALASLHRRIASLEGAASANSQGDKS